MRKIRTLKRGKKWSNAFEIGGITGKRKAYQKSGFATKTEAYEAGIKIYDEYMHGGISIHDGKICFADFIDDWFEKDCKPGLRFSTAYNYEIYIRLHIKPSLGSYQLKDLTPAIIDNWIRKIAATKKLVPLYIKMIFLIAKKALDYAVYPAGIINTNPAQYVKVPKIKAGPKKIKRVIIENDTLSTILNSLPRY